MLNKKDRPIIAKEDHNIIMGYLKNGLNRIAFNKPEAEKLEAELKRAKLVEKTKLPEDVVCLNSTVILKEEKEDKLMELTLVIPEKADITHRKISILSPIAAALIGFRKGTRVAWRASAGLKTFCILDVRNSLQRA